jgi:LPXTG-motif cell wall-anchored protein
MSQMCIIYTNGIRLSEVGRQRVFFKIRRGDHMYGRVLGTSTTAPAVAVLPSTGDNKALFYVALAMLGAGVVTLVASTLVARKNR